MLLSFHAKKFCLAWAVTEPDQGRPTNLLGPRDCQSISFMQLFENKILYKSRSGVWIINQPIYKFVSDKADFKSMKFQKNWSLLFLLYLRSEICQAINSETGLQIFMKKRQRNISCLYDQYTGLRASNVSSPLLSGKSISDRPKMDFASPASGSIVWQLLHQPQVPLTLLQQSSNQREVLYFS